MTEQQAECTTCVWRRDKINSLSSKIDEVKAYLTNLIHEGEIEDSEIIETLVEMLNLDITQEANVTVTIDVTVKVKVPYGTTEYDFDSSDFDVDNVDVSHRNYDTEVEDSRVTDVECYEVV